MKDWQQIIKEYESFEGEVRHFCKVKKIAPSSFYKWKKKLTTDSVSRFIEVSTARISNHIYEIEYPNGVKVRPQGALSLEVLQSLIHV